MLRAILGIDLPIACEHDTPAELLGWSGRKVAIEGSDKRLGRSQGTAAGWLDGLTPRHSSGTSRPPPYESASPTGPIMPVSCGIRRWGWPLTAKVTAKW
jgi:hypothetical protein